MLSITDIGGNVVVRVVTVVTISSHRAPVKFGGQIQAKPPTDVSEHVPPWKQGKIAHGLGGAVARIAREKKRTWR